MRTDQTEKGKRMKTNRINTLPRVTGIIIAITSLASLTLVNSANAQYKPVGEDGIAASPKLRQTLEERKARLNTAPAPVASMTCPKCKDEYTRRTDWTARGANKPTMLVAKHLCGGCETLITKEGQGKAAHDVVIHKCTGCGSASLACCSTTPGSKTATKGMEKPVEIAPLR